ncbi:MAG: hypothetical protein LBQ96_02530 [Fusobacteriaceae bacterium]|jgi:hypothetical protein|nr:hypothetical protein [Fusobacteriaceae bacterium]
MKKLAAALWFLVFAVTFGKATTPGAGANTTAGVTKTATNAAAEAASEAAGKKVLARKRAELAKEGKEAAPTRSVGSGKAKKAATAKGPKKVMKQQREDLFESLEEKVFRAPNNTGAELAAGEKAFETGKKRMYYLNREEAEIKEYAADYAEQGATADYLFLGDQFDATRDEFLSKKAELEALDREYATMQKYLAQLEAMEKRAAAGRTR